MSENSGTTNVVVQPQIQSIGKLGAALAKAQGAMSPPPKNKTNPFFNSKYADLADCIEHTKKALSDNGLAISQVIDLNTTNSLYYLKTILLHSSGEHIESKYLLPKGLTPQKFGSELTYARRYSFCAIIGISADDDDDANLATSANKTAQAPRREATTKPKSPVMEQFENARVASRGGSLPPGPDLDSSNEGSGSNFGYEECSNYLLEIGKRDHKNFGKPLSSIHRQDLHKLQAWLEKMSNPDAKALETLTYVKQFLILDAEVNK